MFDGDADGIAQLQEDKNFKAWDDEQRQALLTGLLGMAADCRQQQAPILNRDTFFKALLQACAPLTDVKKLKPAQLKLIEKYVRKPSEDADICTDKHGKAEADADLRDYENVPFREDIQTYVQREVFPHVPDAWIDTSKCDDKDGKVGIVGYEINFNRYFYQYTPPRSLHDIDADLKASEARIAAMLNEVAE